MSDHAAQRGQDICLLASASLTALDSLRIGNMNPMQGDDFLVEVDDSWGPNSEPWQTRLELNRELLHSLSLAPVAGYIEVEVAQSLVDLVSEELAAFGTSGGERLDNQDIALAIKAMQSVLARLAIPFKMPFRDFTRFRSYWIRLGAAGSYQARRDILEKFFEPVIARLADLEQVTTHQDDPSVSRCRAEFLHAARHESPRS